MQITTTIRLCLTLAAGITACGCSTVAEPQLASAAEPAASGGPSELHLDSPKIGAAEAVGAWITKLVPDDPTALIEFRPDGTGVLIVGDDARQTLLGVRFHYVFQNGTILLKARQTENGMRETSPDGQIDVGEAEIVSDVLHFRSGQFVPLTFYRTQDPTHLAMLRGS